MSVSLHEYRKWKKNENLHKLPEIGASYDMGWQQRSSGRTYNCVSGHGMMIGCRTSKVIDAVVLSKQCNICYGIKNFDTCLFSDFFSVKKENVWERTRFIDVLQRNDWFLESRNLLLIGPSWRISCGSDIKCRNFSNFYRPFGIVAMEKILNSRLFNTRLKRVSDSSSVIWLSVISLQRCLWVFKSGWASSM